MVEQQTPDTSLHPERGLGRYDHRIPLAPIHMHARTLGANYTQTLRAYSDLSSGHLMHAQIVVMMLAEQESPVTLDDLVTHYQPMPEQRSLPICSACSVRKIYKTGKSITI